MLRRPLTVQSDAPGGAADGAPASSSCTKRGPCLSGMITKQNSSVRKHQKAHVQGAHQIAIRSSKQVRSNLHAQQQRKAKKIYRKEHGHRWGVCTLCCRAHCFSQRCASNKVLAKSCGSPATPRNSAMPLTPGRNFSVVCQLHYWSLDFAAAVVEERRRSKIW